MKLLRLALTGLRHLGVATLAVLIVLSLPASVVSQVGQLFSLGLVSNSALTMTTNADGGTDSFVVESGSPPSTIFEVDSTGDVVVGGLPADLILFTSAGVCPTGFTEYTNLRGRYPVGLGFGFTNEQTVGTAFTTTGEDRAVGQHNHATTESAHDHPQDAHNHPVSDPGHSHDVDGIGNLLGSFNVTLQGDNNTQTDSNAAASRTTGLTVSNATANNQTSTTGLTIDNAGSVVSTSAPYIQLMACKKN